MDSLILSNARRDMPLYLDEFKNFWQQTETELNDSDLTKCYTTTLIFKNWKIALNHIGVYKLDSILNEICDDINLAFFLAYFGQYRSSHMHLRSLIELSLQILYFYQHEVELTQWKSGEFRIKHDELTNYLKKHPCIISTSAENLLIEITKNWKLYSKYIHAEAPVYFQTSLESSQTKQISLPDFNKWKSNFLKIGYKLNRLFLIFFKQKMTSFPNQSKEILLKTLRDDDIRELGLDP